MAHYGIKMTPGKCILMQDTITFLGHTFSAEGVHPEEDKVTRINDLPSPTSKHELNSVIGLFNFFRNFLPNYSFHSAKLTALTRNNNTWREGSLP